MSAITSLLDLFTFLDGRRMAEGAQWGARRGEVLDILQREQYGYLPPAPEAVEATLLHPFTFTEAGEFLGAHYRLACRPGGFSFLVTLYQPRGDGPYPLIIDGDGCWRYVNDNVLRAVMGRGYALALFNRVEIVPDAGSTARDTGLYLVHPEGDFGALAAWAWGYHRVVDFALGLPQIDGARIAATGHSRGGKAALLAGATDTRIALTAPNDSGAGGAGCYRIPDAGGERLADLMRNFPFWFTPRLAHYVSREAEMPFDQHFLKAAVAPRALLTTEARSDHWASPHGTRLTYEAAREVYRFLGIEEKIGLWYRDGGHAHTLADWFALLDFADRTFYGKAVETDFDMRP